MFDFTFIAGDFNTTTVEIFPESDKSRKFFNVDDAVASFVVKKSVFLEVLQRADDEGVSFQQRS